MITTPQNKLGHNMFKHKEACVNTIYYFKYILSSQIALPEGSHRSICSQALLGLRPFRVESNGLSAPLPRTECRSSWTWDPPSQAAKQPYQGFLTLEWQPAMGLCSPHLFHTACGILSSAESRPHLNKTFKVKSPCWSMLHTAHTML